MALRFDPRSIWHIVHATVLQPPSQLKMNLPNLNTLFEVYKTILSSVPFGEGKRSTIMKIDALQFNLVKKVVIKELNSFIIL